MGTIQEEHYVPQFLYSACLLSFVFFLLLWLSFGLGLGYTKWIGSFGLKKKNYFGRCAYRLGLDFGFLHFSQVRCAPLAFIASEGQACQLLFLSLPVQRFLAISRLADRDSFRTCHLVLFLHVHYEAWRQEETSSALKYQGRLGLGGIVLDFRYPLGLTASLTILSYFTYIPVQRSDHRYRAASVPALDDMIQ